MQRRCPQTLIAQGEEEEKAMPANLPLLEYQNDVEQDTVNEGDQEQDDCVQLEADAPDTERLQSA